MERKKLVCTGGMFERGVKFETRCGLGYLSACSVSPASIYLSETEDRLKNLLAKEVGPITIQKRESFNGKRT